MRWLPRLQGPSIHLAPDPVAARSRGSLAAIVACLALAACSGSNTYQLPLMPAPEYLDDASFDPFTGSAVLPADARPQVLYATLRAPAGPDDTERFYTNRRSLLVRVGQAGIDVSPNTTWAQLREIGLVRAEGRKFTLRVDGIEEFGVLAPSRPAYLRSEATAATDDAATRRFAAEINAQLAAREVKDIFIYVHGYRVNFDNPTLISGELWHFLGYEGVFIPFAWPSRLGRLAYFGDTESARFSARGFREFLAFLARETDVRKIHIVGYSAGTRMVLLALAQQALLDADVPPDAVRRKTRLGNVILVGSDVDTGVATGYAIDGLLNVAEHFTFYESPADSALGMAKRVLGQDRVGQLRSGTDNPGTLEFLRAHPDIALISVKDAPAFDSGNGHSYFKDAPRVSSDILATLRYGLTPAERGLAPPAGDELAWTFPTDYVERLQAAVAARRGGTAR
jgi:esterase/lipase superfamily enzyme